MGSVPGVTVVVPTRDRWEVLSRRALPAALAQEGVDLEVVVVDDGSRDRTAEELARAATLDSRVRLIRRDRPGGVAAARNAGIAAARAPWIAFLDDDDLWSRRKLAVQLEAAERERAEWVYTGAVAVDERLRPLYEYYFPEPAEIAEQLLRAAVVPAGASNVLARTALVRRLGGFDERFRHVEDWDFWIQLSAEGVPSATREILVAVVFHAGSKHAVHDQADEIDRLIRKHASTSRPLDVDSLGHARWVAGEHARVGLYRRAAWLYTRDALRHRSAMNLLRAADALVGKRLSRVLQPRLHRAGEVPTPPWLSVAASAEPPAA